MIEPSPAGQRGIFHPGHRVPTDQPRTERLAGFRAHHHEARRVVVSPRQVEEPLSLGTVGLMSGPASLLTRRVVRLVCSLVVAAAVLGACAEGGPPERSDAAKAMRLSRCAALFENTSQLRCYGEHFDEVRLTEGLAASLDQIVELHNSPTGAPFAAHCHEVLHTLGRTAMSTAGNDERRRLGVFADSRITCTGGFVHGALTEYLTALDRDELIRSYEGLCTTLAAGVGDILDRDADASGWLSWNCNHMMGHALYWAHTDDLVSGANLCGVFDDESDQRLGCEAGFFMEHYLVVGRSPGTGYSSTPESLDDVHRLCRDVDGAVSRGCWSESGGVVYITAGRDWAAAGAACRSLATGTLLEACYEGLGRNIAPYAGFEPAQMRTWCADLGDQYAREICSIQIAGSQAMELYRPEAGLEICTDVVDPARRQRCEDSVNGTKSQLDSSGFTGGVGW
jgi:hypothetical protein